MMSKKSIVAIMSGLALLVIIIIAFLTMNDGPYQLGTQSQEGYSLGLVSDQKVSSNNYFFKVNNGLLQGSIKIGNEFNAEQSFFLTTFLDYEQKKIMLNEQEELIHKIKVKPKSSVSFDFNLQVPEGNHDLFVMLIRDPEDKSQSFYLPAERVMFRRAFVQTGKEIDRLEPITEISYQKGADNGVISFLDANNNRLSSSRRGESFFLNIAPPQEVGNYLLFAVLNGKQISFSVGGSEYVNKLYQLNSEGPLKMTFSIQDNLPGQLFAVLIPNPYTVRENEQGVINKDVYWTIFPTSKVQLYD